MAVIEKFKHLTQNESTSFSSILKIMTHTKKQEGRGFLCALNNIIDHTFEQQSHTSVNYHIIHIPDCSDWARELLVHFVIHKVALTFNRKIIEKANKLLKKTVEVPLGITIKSREGKRLKEERGYYKEIQNNFSNLTSIFNNNKSLFLVKDSDVISRNEDRNPWLQLLFSNNIYDKGHNVIISSEKTAYSLEEDVRKTKNAELPIIENIFLFHSSNRNKVTNSYNLDQINRLNKYGLGIKNCIVFSLSFNPLKLYHTIDNTKYRLISGLMNKTIKKYDDFEGFITFTQQESDYIFNRKLTQKNIIIDPSEREIFTSFIDSFLDQLPHNFRYKNALSMAFSDELQQIFLKEIIKDFGIFDPEIFADFFNYYKQIWSENIKPKIDTFLGESHSVAFIVPRETTVDTMQFIKTHFYILDRKINFFKIEDLKKGINCEKIVVLQYRYTDKIFKSYPNSFDKLPIKTDQEALLIINRLTHNNYYEWNKHYYDKNFNGLLFSSYRKRILDWTVQNFQKPLLPDIVDILNEAEVDSREYQTEKCIVHYEGARSKEHFSYERVLVKSENNYEVLQLKELSTEEIIEIQLLDELVEQIRTSLIKMTKDNSKAEEYIRNDERYNLTEDEIKSSVELWKILLKRKVDELGVDTVYQSIFPTLKEISINGFLHWFDCNYPMILPRSRLSQNLLLTYLGFEIGSPYHRVVLIKKLGNINNSRVLNRQIEGLLQSILTKNIVTEKDFEILLEGHSDILTLLEIKNTNDVNTLISLLEISLRPVNIEMV